MVNNKNKRYFKPTNLELFPNRSSNILYVVQPKLVSLGKSIESSLKVKIQKNMKLISAVTDNNSIPIVISLSDKTETKTIYTHNGPRIIMTFNAEELHQASKPIDSKIESTLIQELLKANKTAKSYLEPTDKDLHQKFSDNLGNSILEIIKIKNSGVNPTKMELLKIASTLQYNINSEISSNQKTFQFSALVSMISEYNAFLEVVDPGSKFEFQDLSVKNEIKTVNLSLKLGGTRYQLIKTELLINDLAQENEYQYVQLIKPSTNESASANKGTSNKKAPDLNNKKTIASSGDQARELPHTKLLGGVMVRASCFYDCCLS